MTFPQRPAAAEKIYQVICHWIVRDYKIRSILGQVKTFDGQQLRHNFPPPSPGYEVLMSVLNPRPDLQTLHWNVKQATERYLRPFLTEFNELSEFTLKSQRKYQLELKYGTKAIEDDSKIGRHFPMNHDTLPQIITSIERKLGTDVANKPCIHLVIYVPPCKLSPVYIYKSGQRVSNHSFDSFISAKWGGIVIANPSEKVCVAVDDDVNVKDIHLDSHEIMDFVLYQLRKIFELEVDIPITGAALEAIGDVKPRLWEKDMYLRNGAIHLISSASSTLQSLVKLLDDIKNIVIGDHVGAEIQKSYDNIVRAKQALSRNDVKNSVKYARDAFISAEKAFNDPSLLELLYFPEEQKYAIYIPLYLPIMIPVIMSIFTVKKYFFSKNKDSQEEKMDGHSEQVNANEDGTKEKNE